MNSNKRSWFEKASVQAALVNTIPALLVAIVGIFFTWRATRQQLEQSLGLFKIQMERDSILHIKQTDLNNKQLTLNAQELELVKQQTKQDSINLLISISQNSILNSQRAVTKSANWGKLRNSMWKIMDLTNCGIEGYPGLDKLSTNEKLKRSNQIWELLNSEIDNPVLIENPYCLGYWRNAISKTIILKDSIHYSIRKFSDLIDSLMDDVFVVWEDLVLYSDEISPTGGKPSVSIRKRHNRKK